MENGILITKNEVEMEVSLTSKKSIYNPEFVAKVKRSEAQMKKEKGVKIATEDLWK